jgi:hypothetical protein
VKRGAEILPAACLWAALKIGNSPRCSVQRMKGREVFFTDMSLLIGQSSHQEAYIDARLRECWLDSSPGLEVLRVMSVRVRD